MWSDTDDTQSFGAVTAAHYDADYQINAISGRGVVRNYNGFKGDTLPQAYPYVLFDKKQKYDDPAWRPQVLVIALGTNDFSTPLNPGEPWKTREELHADYEATYVKFLQELRAKNPKAYIIVWATDMANGEIEAEAGKVVQQIKQQGDQHISFLPIDELSFGVRLASVACGRKGHFGKAGAADRCRQIGKRAMTQREFKVVITESSVDVRRDVSSKSQKGRFYMGLFFLAFVILTICGLVFLPGKHDAPSMWHDISTSPINSGDLIFPLSLVLLFAVSMGFLATRYLLAAYPSDEAVHCDQSTLIVSKIPWLDVSNSKWTIRSYPLKDVSQLRFGIIASAKGYSIYGICFVAEGKTQRVLSGLEAPEAAEILRALKELGADVVNDPKLSKKVEATLRRR